MYVSILFPPSTKSHNPPVNTTLHYNGRYVLHPASMNAEQSQGITRMRQAAAMGNFELCRSLFKKNFDTAVKVKKGKLTVGKNAPT